MEIPSMRRRLSGRPWRESYAAANGSKETHVIAGATALGHVSRDHTA